MTIYIYIYIYIYTHALHAVIDRFATTAAGRLDCFVM